MEMSAELARGDVKKVEAEMSGSKMNPETHIRANASRLAKTGSDIIYSEKQATYVNRTKSTKST